MQESAPQWYAVKVFYNKVFELETLLGAQGYTTYLAADKLLLKGDKHAQARRRIASFKADGRTDTRFIEEGPVIYQRVPMVNSLLFVLADADGIKEIDTSLQKDSAPVKGFIYKKWDEKSSRYGYAAIPASEMEAFRLITSQGSEGLEFFSADDISCFATGCKVRVTDGPFKGAIGYIKRIKRNRRLLVAIEGIVAVVSAYIDPRLLEAM